MTELSPCLSLKRYRVAAFVDGENISCSHTDDLLQHLSKTGEVLFCRVFGDYSKPCMQKWLKLDNPLVQIIHCASVSTFKNASDIRMTINVTEVVKQHKVDIFCLVSSDSDFTPLANYIREQGLIVHVYGADKTPPSLVRACHRFTVLHQAESSKTPELTEISRPTELVAMLEELINTHQNNDGFLLLGRLGQLLRENNPSFNARPSLSKMLKKFGFSVEKRTIKGIEYAVVMGVSRINETNKGDGVAIVEATTRTLLLPFGHDEILCQGIE